ncbi:ribonuclease HII [bacterium BMS3Abin03]|jgi:ribonuclease HII|nr:ribonuclease HII [bacterium BMS3Abin03]MCG6958576.1 ribonuclease HII [bacterium BMS3Abin03]
MKHFDNSFLSEQIELIAGVDEAGRGPLAGPVVAAAVIFEPSVYIDGVNDSKKLSETQRENLYPLILKKSLTYGISAVSPAKIDSINILNASLLAMLNSINKLEIKPELILVDGNRAFNCNIPVRTVIKGDAKSFCIAAASIIAKVTRDRLMKRLAGYYPAYRWEKNKGYPTKQHIETLKLVGPSPLHRKSFLRKILEVSEPELKLQHVKEE